MAMRLSHMNKVRIALVIGTLLLMLIGRYVVNVDILENKGRYKPRARHISPMPKPEFSSVLFKSPQRR